MTANNPPALGYVFQVDGDTHPTPTQIKQRRDQERRRRATTPRSSTNAPKRAGAAGGGDARAGARRALSVRDPLCDSRRKRTAEGTGRAVRVRRRLRRHGGSGASGPGGSDGIRKPPFSGDRFLIFIAGHEARSSTNAPPRAGAARTEGGDEHGGVSRSFTSARPRRTTRPGSRLTPGRPIPAPVRDRDDAREQAEICGVDAQQHTSNRRFDPLKGRNGCRSP